MDARTDAEARAVCESDPRLLSPAFDAWLTNVGQELRSDGHDVGSVAFGRLVLRSVREGRNLFAGVDRLRNARSMREIRDAALDEPLVLDPAVDGLFVRFIRGLRQGGHEDFAAQMEVYRTWLGYLRTYGAVEGYYEWLAAGLVVSQDERTESLIAEASDIRQELSDYLQTAMQKAVEVQDHQRAQRLLYAVSLVDAVEVRVSVDADVGDSTGWLYSIMHWDVPRSEQRDELLARPELLQPPNPVMAMGLLRSEMDSAALDLDAVTVRRLWLSRKVLARAQEVGVAQAFDELEGGGLCPSRDETI